MVIYYQQVSREKLLLGHYQKIQVYKKLVKINLKKIGFSVFNFTTQKLFNIFSSRIKKWKVVKKKDKSII